MLSLSDGLNHLIQGPDDTTSHMSWEWGTVLDDLQILQEGDVTPLPSDVTTLVPLSPGMRVVIFRYGQSLLVVGSSRAPITLEPGEHADSYLAPGSFVVGDPFFVTPEFGFPDVSSPGWLEVEGNGTSVLQRFTSQGTMDTFTRILVNGAWTPWSGSNIFSPITLSAPWTQYGTVSTWGSPSFHLEGPIVHLSGMVTGGTSDQPLAVLPVAARPTKTRIFTAVANYQPAVGEVHPSGSLSIRTPLDSGWVSLSSISFPK